MWMALSHHAHWRPRGMDAWRQSSTVKVIQKFSSQLWFDLSGISKSQALILLQKLIFTVSSTYSICRSYFVVAAAPQCCVRLLPVSLVTLTSGHFCYSKWPFLCWCDELRYIIRMSCFQRGRVIVSRHPHCLGFLPRCMECRRGPAIRIMSVCPSLCLSN